MCFASIHVVNCFEKWQVHLVHKICMTDTTALHAQTLKLIISLVMFPFESFCCQSFLQHDCDQSMRHDPMLFFFVVTNSFPSDAKWILTVLLWGTQFSNSHASPFEVRLSDQLNQKTMPQTIMCFARNKSNKLSKGDDKSPGHLNQSSGCRTTEVVHNTALNQMSGQRKRLARCSFFVFFSFSFF